MVGERSTLRRQAFLRPCLDLHFYLNPNRADSQTSFLLRLTDSLANSRYSQSEGRRNRLNVLNYLRRPLPPPPQFPKSVFSIGRASLTVSVRPASVPLSCAIAFSAAVSSAICTKAKPFEPSGIAICDDLSRFNLADRAEHIAKVSFCGLERKVSNEFLLPSQQYTLQIQIHESESPQLCSVDFPFDRMTPKGGLPRKQLPPIPVVIETCKGYAKRRSFLADSFLDCFRVAVEYFQEESLRMPTGA